MIWKELDLIPGFLINQYGDVVWRDKVRTQYLNEEGYLRVAVKIVGKGWVTIPVQRLSAAAFISDEHLLNPDMHVNHRDLDKFNNHYSNLEWITSEENNLHQAMFRLESDRPIIILIDNDGKELFFNTVYTCAEFLEVDPLDIWDTVRLNDKIKGYYARYISSSGPKPSALFSDNRPSIDIVTGRFNERSVKIRDVFTGEQFSYPSLSSCANETGLSRSLLTYSLGRKNKVTLIGKRFQIAYEEDNFVDLSNIDLSKSRGSKEVIAFNVDTKEEKIFPSASIFYKENFLSKKSVTATLAKRSVRQIGKFIFCYLNDGELVKEVRNFVSAL